MIKTEKEYQNALERLKAEKELINKTQKQLESEGFTQEQVKRGIDPLICFSKQLEDEVETYERIKKGDLATIENFDRIGREVIAMRIANNVSQTELAKRLEVDNTQICKWEANEYFGVKLETMEKIMTALGYKAVTSFKKLA